MADANQLVFTNVENHTITVYFGISIPKKEQLSYSLPPVPFENLFDVRFVDDMVYTETGGYLEITNQSFPLTMSYTLTEADPDVAWQVKNPETGDVYTLADLSGMVTIESASKGLVLVSESVLPTEYALDQNYPNPFNPSTTIRYALPEESKVTLVIYDILGREVIELVSETQPAGKHQVVWQGQNAFGQPVASGIYIYRYSAGGYTDMKKMLLLR